MYAQTDYRVDKFPASLFGAKTDMLLLAGFKYEDERGFSLSGTTTAKRRTERHRRPR